jgi:hypothetical protein
MDLSVSNWETNFPENCGFGFFLIALSYCDEVCYEKDNIFQALLPHFLILNRTTTFLFTVEKWRFVINMSDDESNIFKKDRKIDAKFSGIL